MAIWWSLQLEELVDATAAARVGSTPTLESGNLSEGAFVVDRIKGVNDVPVLSAVVPILQDNFPGTSSARSLARSRFRTYTDDARLPRGSSAPGRRSAEGARANTGARVGEQHRQAKQGHRRT